MKKIFIIIFVLIISLRGLSQNSFPINATNGSQTTGVLTKGRLSVDSLLQINTTCFADTIAANRGHIDEIKGAIIRLCNNSLMLRNNTATAWIGLGGAGTISTINFYSDSSLIICYGNGVCDTISFSNTINNSITNIYNNSIVNIFVYNDSCVILETGDGTDIDTICTQFDCGITGWNILSDSTIEICGFICPDTTTIICDTFSFPSTPLFLFDNGLTQSPPGHVQWGGTLKHYTYVDADYNRMDLLGRTIQNYPVTIRQYQSWTNSTPILGMKNDNEAVRIGFNYIGDPIRTAAQGGYIPGYVTPYKGYALSSNAIGSIYEPNGKWLVDSNTWKSAVMLMHGRDTANHITFSFIGWYPSFSGNVTSSNGSSAIIMNLLDDGRVQLPQYVNIADANTDSAFYKDPTDGTMKYGKVNTGATTPAGNYGDIQINRNNVFSTPASDSLIYNSARLTVLGHQTITSANVSGTTTSASLVLNANSLTSGTGLYAASSTLAGGSLVNLVVNSPDGTNTQKVINVSTAGTNSNSSISTYGIYSSNTHTGTGSKNYGGFFTSTGGASKNYGVVGSVSDNNGWGVWGTTSGQGYGVVATTSANTGTATAFIASADATGATTAIGGSFTASAATNNYAIIVPDASGSVGIGTSTPTTGTLLEVANNNLAGTSLVKINSANTLAASNAQKLLDISLSGANNNSGQLTYGIYSSNTHTGTDSRNYGVYGTSTGGTYNYGIYGLTASGGTGVYGDNGAGSGWGVYGTTASGYGIAGFATTGFAIGGEISGNGMPLYLLKNNAGTNDVRTIIEMDRGSSGTTAAGFGSRIESYLQSTVQLQLAGQIINKYTSATDATRTTQWIITGIDSAATVNLLTLDGTGYMLLKTMTAAVASTISAADGMIVYVSSTDATFTSVGFWGRENGAWVKL